MISTLNGTVSMVGSTHCVLDVGGVGLLVWSTPATLTEIRTGGQAKFHTSLQVREDSLTLFGFQSADERTLFETLLGISGIGAKTALAILGVHSPQEVMAAATQGDDKAFTRVPGIGPKSARRIVLELADKLVPLEGASPTGQPPIEEQVVAALTGLGWSEKDSTAAVHSTLEAQPQLAGAEVAQVLRATLVGIGKKGR